MGIYLLRPVHCCAGSVHSAEPAGCRMRCAGCPVHRPLESGRHPSTVPWDSGKAKRAGRCVIEPARRVTKMARLQEFTVYNWEGGGEGLGFHTPPPYTYCHSRKLSAINLFFIDEFSRAIDCRFRVSDQLCCFGAMGGGRGSK